MSMSTELPNLRMVSFSGRRGKRLDLLTPANTYYVTLRVKATDNSFASKPAERLSVTTPDILQFQGPSGAVSFEAKGTYGQTLDRLFRCNWQRDLRLLILVGMAGSRILELLFRAERNARFLHLSGCTGKHCISGGIYPGWSTGRKVWK